MRLNITEVVELEVELEREQSSIFFGSYLETASFCKAVKSQVQPIVLLEGDPASGKSCQLLNAVLKLSKDAGAGKGRIPVYVNLNKFVPGKSTFLEYVRRWTARLAPLETATVENATTPSVRE